MITKKVKYFILWLVIFSVIVAVGVWFYLADFSSSAPTLGVTFSRSYTEYLGLDWKKTYSAILDDLKVKNIRLVAEWQEIEPDFGRYDFSALDWQIQEADRRGAKVILTIGRRVPRWPECHDPKWVKDLTPEKTFQEQLVMMTAAVQHFKKFANLEMWQVENEPFLTSFGECPMIIPSEVKQEIALVKSLDARPVMVSDTGELSSWAETAHLGDYFGHTLYRLVYNQTFGYLTYLQPPAFYRLKSWLAGLKMKNVFVAELQAEPWSITGQPAELLAPTTIKMMSAEQIEKNYRFARRTGAARIYFWGVEWWYLLKEKGIDNTRWTTAQKIFSR
jgi:hypothetical protein